MVKEKANEYSSLRKTLLAVLEIPDPGFAMTATSIATNFVISNMLLYGLTGRARFSYLLSVFTVPCSVFLCLRDSRNDYERWKELRSLRIRGVPDKFMPYKCKYDWTNYEKVLNKKTDK
ncbi:hypothetical protein RB195_024440 [Necator americanus]|uniref:Uncharacterized protein n=1 Tax=Necator americanus TaxID=51031 RepID=A0ABR1EN67_NECAM